MLGQDVVRLECLPDVYEIIQLLEVGNVEPGQPLARIGFLQKIDDLGFSRSGTSG